MGGSAITASTLVIWVGEVPAPSGALTRMGIEAWALPPDVATRELVALAPDLIVLAGPSAARAQALLRELAAERPLGAVPIAVVGAGGGDTEETGGVVARIDAAQPDDAIAAAIAGVIARLEGDGRAQRSLDARGIERWVAELVAQRRAALLLRGSPPGALAIAADGRRAAALGARGEGSSVVRVYERAPGKLAVLGAVASPESAADETSLEGVAAVVVDDGMADWDGVARALEEAGAKVTLADAERGAIEEARARDPVLIVVAPSVLATPAGLLLCEDSRLASASLLAVHVDPRVELDPARVVRAARRLCAGEIALRARALAGEAIVARIEALGVVRWLKTFADAGMAARLRLRAASGCGEIRVEGGKIREATFEPREGGEVVHGGAAARALLSLRRGTILAAPVDAPLHERARPPALREDPGQAFDEESTTVASRDELRALGARTSEGARGERAEERASAAETEPEPASESIAVEDGEASEAASESTAAEPTTAPAVAREPVAAEPASVAEPTSAPGPARAATPGARAVAGRAPEPAAPTPAPRTEARPAADRAPEPAAPPRRRSAGAIAGAIALVGGVAVAAYAWSARSERASDPVVETVFAEPPAGDAPSHDDAPLAEQGAPDAAPAEHAPAPAEQAAADSPAAEAADAVPAEQAAADAVPDEQPAADTPAAEPPVAEAPVTDAPAASSAVPAGASANRIVLAADEALRRRDYAEALALADRALAVDPSHPRATYDRALSLLRLGRDEEALESATRAVQLDREEPLYPLLVGDIHQQYGRRARARAAWRACTEMAPEFEPCQRRLERAEGR